MRTTLIVLLLALPGAVAAQSAPINLSYARTYFAELDQLGKADGGKLWGRPVAGAMLLADRATRVVVANMPDVEGKLREEDGVWVGSLPAEFNIASTAITWAGRTWAMVVWPLSDNKYARGRLMMHESFHRVQNELALNAADRASSHLASASARIWMRLEFRALTEAVLREGSNRRQALRDALTFRARRHSEFQHASEDERLLELNEGLAEYTGHVLSGLPRHALHDRIAAQLGQYEWQENFSRTFAYATGPAYGLILDAAGRPWRDRLTRDSDLSALAAAAYRIASVSPAEAELLVSRYAGERMAAEERGNEARRVATEARLRARLVDGPTLTLPVLDEFHYSFDPGDATPLSDLGTAFTMSRITDSWGVLNVTSGGVLMLRSNGRITGVVVPVTTEHPPTKGEGWELQLKPGWTVRTGERAGDWIVARAGD